MADGTGRSLRALDTLNFCNAGIQTGLGPFIAIFYSSERHWNPAQIGVLLACQAFAGIGVQPFTGSFIDQTRQKKLVTIVAALIVAAGAAGVAIFPQYGVQIAVQLVIGLSITVFPAATSAFALGLAERQQLPKRIARNESFTHGGNMIFAAIAGAAGAWLSLSAIFYAAAAFAAGMAGATAFIDSGRISHDAARGGLEPSAKGEAKPVRELIRDRNVLVFTALVVLFNVANGATLALVSQILARQKGGSSSWKVAAAVFTAELVMVLVAARTGTEVESRGRKPLFLAAFAVLTLRNGLTLVSHATVYLVALQSLDGVAAGIYGVLLTLVSADLARGTGRFNFLQGAVQSSMGLGVFLSNALFGFIAKSAGFNASFAGLAGVALFGGVFSHFKMSETKPKSES